VPFVGDECLIFPFCRNKHGIGRLTQDGITVGAHVAVLTLCAGQKPTFWHECCHECGNGHEGCVNPRHLYWWTRVDNVADAARHGTLRGGRPKGYYHPGFKLKTEMRPEVYQMLEAGVLQKDIAEHFGISEPYVSKLKRLMAV
jgi:hypothetical protein